MKITLYILCIIGYLSADAQPNPKNYFDFKDRKELVFADDFDNDKNGWLINEPKGCDSSNNNHDLPAGDSCYINNGIFHFYVKQRGNHRKREFLRNINGS